MDKKKLLEDFSHIEIEVTDILAKVSEMKQIISELMEKNVRLELENKHLRDHLVELEDRPKDKKSPAGLSKSKLNLEKLYEEGFHVCNFFYGSHRESLEECAFCQNVIYGEQTK